MTIPRLLVAIDDNVNVSDRIPVVKRFRPGVDVINLEFDARLGVLQGPGARQPSVASSDLAKAYNAVGPSISALLCLNENMNDRHQA